LSVSDDTKPIYVNSGCRASACFDSSSETSPILRVTWIFWLGFRQEKNSPDNFMAVSFRLEEELGRPIELRTFRTPAGGLA
jgi:hypothetical protein